MTDWFIRGFLDEMAKQDGVTVPDAPYRWRYEEWQWRSAIKGIWLTSTMAGLGMDRNLTVIGGRPIDELIRFMDEHGWYEVVSYPDRGQQAEPDAYRFFQAELRPFRMRLRPGLLDANELLRQVGEMARRAATA